MTFVNLSLLLGGVLTAIPIVLHLAMRRRPKQLVFPALRLVKQRCEANRRRLQVRQWLLLLLRCLAIALLAAALARPTVRSAEAGDWAVACGAAALLLLAVMLTAIAWRLGKGKLLVGLLAATSLILLVGLGSLLVRAAPRRSAPLANDQAAPVSAVLAVDTSPRMQYRRQNETRLEKAQQIAQWLIRQLPPDSEVAVADSRRRRAVFAVDLAAAAKAVERLRTTGTPRPLGLVLQDALELARGGSARNAVRELYIFTDRTEAAWRGEAMRTLADRVQQAPDVLLYVIDVGVDDPQNFALGRLDLSSQAVTSGGELQIETEVTATGEGGPRIVELALEEPDPRLPLIRDGRPQLPLLRPRGRAACTVSAGGAQRVPFRVRGLAQGVHQGQVRLMGEDGLACDDVRYFTVRVRPPWPILVAAPQGVAVRLFTEAIAPYEFRRTGRARFECDVTDPSQLGGQPLARYAAVCLLDPGPLPSDVWERLAEFVRRGGGLAVFLGHNARPEQTFQQKAAQQLLGGRLARQWRAGGDDLFLAPGRLDHPILRVFRPLSTSVPWNRFPVFKHWTLDPLAPDAHVIIPYGNGKPALIEQTLGKGRALTMTTPLTEPARPEGREPWNELASGEDAWPYFVLVNEMMRYLAACGDEKLNYEAGEVAVLPNRADEDPLRYQLFTPLDSPQDVTARDGKITVKFTENPGAYRLKGYRGGPVIRGFSVNLASEASDLRRAAPQRLEEILGGDRFQLARNREEIVFGVRQARAGRPFYSFLVAALALTLGLEHLLANLFYRKHEASAGT